MHNFKLVILDYPIAHLDNPATQTALNHMMVNKQINFARTNPNNVIMDKHDMIGTHYMIYDTSNVYSPKLVLAIRSTFEDRAQQHYLKTPMQEFVPRLDPRAQAHYQAQKSKKKYVADCNSWFVDPDFRQKNSGLKLSDIGYAMVYGHVTRMGFDHIFGCTNEKYRASRWLENIAHFDKSHLFDHPTLPGKHMFIFVEEFKKNYLNSIYTEYQGLFDSLQEILPPDFKQPKWSETLSSLFSDNAVPMNQREAA